MAVYSYLFADLLTNAILGEMPIHGVTMDKGLNKPGNIQGATNLDNDFTSNEDIIAMTQPGRTSLYVYRDDQIVWGGIIWTRTYQSQGKSVQFTGQTFESYAYRRIYRPSKKFGFNEAQCSIINKLWINMQSYANSNIGVSPATSLPSGDVVRDYNVYPWDFKFFSDFIDDITAHDDGCDYYIDTFEVGGVPSKQLIVDYPQIGTGRQPLLVDYPGNILNYYWTENESENNNTYWATGDGDGFAKRVGVSQALNILASGYPLLETVTAYDGVTKQTTIDAHARKDLQNGPTGKAKHQFQIKADDDTESVTDYTLGTSVRTVIEDPRFPDGKDTTFRIVGINITPSSSEGVEEFSLVLQGEDDA